MQLSLLFWITVDTGGPPIAVGLAAALLSAIPAATVAADARALANTSGSAWHPRWLVWSVGAALAGANAGICLVYYLRRKDTIQSGGPQDRWREPVVVSALLAGLGTALFRSNYATDPGVVGGVVLLVAFNAVGFTVAGAHADVHYVTHRLRGSGQRFLFDGYHWPFLLGIIVPGNVVFIVLYLYRRHSLLSRESSDGIGALDAADLSDGLGPPDGASNETETQPDEER